MSRLGDKSYDSFANDEADPLLGTNIQYIAGKYDSAQNVEEGSTENPHGKGNSWQSRWLFTLLSRYVVADHFAARALS